MLFQDLVNAGFVFKKYIMRKTSSLSFGIVAVLSIFLATPLSYSCSKDDKTPAAKGSIFTDTSKLSKMNRYYVFIGTYTDGTGVAKSTGIQIYQMNPDSGSLKFVGVSSNTDNPSYLTIHPSKKWLLAVNESWPGKITSFKIDTTNISLVEINSVASSGNSPCYISIDKTGKYAMAANYSSGSFASFGIGVDGTLTEVLSVLHGKGKSTNAIRQEGPHAHMIDQDTSIGFVYATDLGIDKVHTISLDTTTGKLKLLTSLKSEAGAGPRHFAVHPAKHMLYVLHELKGIIEVSTIKTADGSLQKIQSISSAPAVSAVYPGSADIHITADGRFLYVSNRGELNNIAIFAVNQTDGTLQLIKHVACGGTAPRNFAIDPTGKFLLVANMDSNNIVVFKIDPTTGDLISTGIDITVPKPVCVKFLVL